MSVALGAHARYLHRPLRPVKHNPPPMRPAVHYRSNALEVHKISRPHRRCNTLATPSTPNTADPSALVTDVLQAIEDTGTQRGSIHIQQQHIHTDFGDNVPPERRIVVDDTLCTLEVVGKQQGPPLDNPLIFGNYQVSYTSTQDNSPRTTAACVAVC